MLDPAPVEMSEASLEKIYPNIGLGKTRLPLEEQYELLEDLDAALLANAGHPSYNPASNTVHNFKWAHVRYGNTVQLCAESNATSKGLASDVKLIPNPEKKFQGYMAELTKLSAV